MTSNANRRGDFWGVMVMPYYWILDTYCFSKRCYRPVGWVIALQW